MTNRRMAGAGLLRRAGARGAGGGGGAAPITIYGITNLTAANNYATATTGGALLSTTFTTVLMYRYTEAIASSRDLAGQGANVTNGGWGWRPTLSAGSKLRGRVYRADGAARDVQCLSDQADSKDHIAILEVDGTIANLYMDGNATPEAAVSVVGGILDDASLVTEFGTQNANAQNPATAITIYGMAHSADSLISGTTGIAAYYAACKAAGALQTWSGADHLWMVEADGASPAGTLTDQIGTLDLTLAGTPTLITNTLDMAA